MNLHTIDFNLKLHQSQYTVVVHTYCVCEEERHGISVTLHKYISHWFKKFTERPYKTRHFLVKKYKKKKRKKTGHIHTAKTPIHTMG